MTSTELIKDMLERQKAYDEEVFKKHNVDYVSKSQLESALFDELGELMHAQKADWCWWKFTQEPKDEAKVFEEYIDVVHFALMYEIKFGSGCYQDEDIKWNYNKLKTDLGSIGTYLSKSSYIRAYSEVSDDGDKIQEYLHLCKEVDRSQKDLEDFLLKKRKTSSQVEEKSYEQ